MFIKRPKSRPSLRAREPDAEASGSPLAKSSFTATDDGDVEAPVQDAVADDLSAGSVMERKKAQKKEKRNGAGKIQGGTRLSFGGEGEEEVTGFKPRKSLLSQSIRLPPTPAAETPTASSSTASPSYSREYLSELKASTPSRAPRATVPDAAEQDDDMDSSGLSRVARDKYALKMAADTTAGIPDAAAIASAKMKRQAAVESSKHGGLGENGEDFISLGGGRLVVHDGTDGPHPESRLMREEDEEDEGDEGAFSHICRISVLLMTVQI
jgi:GC-rich sequence DNA-binding factor